MFTFIKLLIFIISRRCCPWLSCSKKKKEPKSFIKEKLSLFSPYKCSFVFLVFEFKINQSKFRVGCCIAHTWTHRPGVNFTFNDKLDEKQKLRKKVFRALCPLGCVWFFKVAASFKRYSTQSHSQMLIRSPNPSLKVLGVNSSQLQWADSKKNLFLNIY